MFGRLEANKNSTLQQVEFWDGVESERSLSEGETEMKKEAKESFKKWVLMEEIHGGHGIFGVKDAYNLLVVPNACAFPIKCIWVDKVTTKAAFFA